MSKYFAKFLILTIILTVALSVNYLFAAWVGPTQAPPGGNAPAPIHVGSVNQVKDGGLSVEALSVFGGGYFQGNVGINEVTNSTGGEQDLNLDVEGAIGAQYYCDEDGNNCTSMASGGGSVAGEVSFFNLATCPAGWSELTAAKGRYLTGLPSGGTLAATVGTALSNQENRPTGNHYHRVFTPSSNRYEYGVNDGPIIAASARSPSTGNVNLPYWWSPGGVGSRTMNKLTANGTVVPNGTNAPYLQLLVCQKD